MPIAKIEFEKRKDPLWMIIISIVIGSILMVYPIAYEHQDGDHPLMLMMTMLFWILYQPVWCGVWFAFGMGFSLICC